MQQFGQLLLLVTFLATLATALTAFAGALTRNRALMRGGIYGLYASTALAVAMSIVLTHGFLAHDFSSKYIAAYSDRTMPLMYLIASFWGGEKGALLFWVTSLSIFSAIAVYTRRGRDPVYLSWVVGALASAIFFFDVLMVFESSPFEVFGTSAAPTDGQGLNPLLQNPAMAFHPPAMLTGYIAFTIPFAFGFAALVTGKLDVQWITDTRVWTIISWCFLSVGLILGALWAYQELGWGFYWMWDPVENAGLIPWFTGTAFLHSVMIQERRGMLKRWNVVLVCLTFLLCIFGTFLTRSQLIDSVHAFADSSVAGYFVWYMLGLVVLMTGLIAWRWRELRAEADIESMWSRESMFVINNVLLVGCAFTVLWGTLFPKVSELPSVQGAYNSVIGAWNGTLGGVLGQAEPIDQAVTLGEVWFNGVMAPIGIVLLIVMGIGPMIPWRRATRRSFRRNILPPLAGAALITGIGTAIVSLDAIGRLAHRYDLTWSDAYANWAGRLQIDHLYTVIAYLFCVFVTWTMGREFHKGARLRQARTGVGYLGALVALTFRSPRRYGGYIIHLGVVFMFIAFTGKVFKTQLPERPMSIGDQISVDDYHLTYIDADERWDGDEGYALTRATITVLDGGQTVARAQVDELAAWLTERGVGTFHVETSLDSPKMLVRFSDTAARDRLRDDFWLARTFSRDFVHVSTDASTASQRWRIGDLGLIKVQPMAAAQKVRGARSALGPGSTFEDQVTIEASGGSAAFTLRFADAAAMADFDARLTNAPIPDDLVHGGYDPDTGALAFVDRRTGTHLFPEVRFYAKHDTPTTETAITSRLHEDLYIAMRPAMGRAVINLLPVVFPLVSFLWAGAIVLVLGTLVSLTPPWLARTLIAMTRRRVRGAGATATIVLLSLALVGATGPPAAADARRPQPRGMAAPASAAAALDDALGALRCGCGAPDAPGAAGRTLAADTCVCQTASEERAVVAQLMADYGPSQLASGSAKLEMLTRLVEIDATWDSRLRFDTTTYESLLQTTKTTCPGERGLVLSQSQIGCTVRNRWLPRFRVMLAAGMGADDIYRFYVDENNATMEPTVPWSYDDLRAHADEALGWAVPAAGLVVLLVGLVLYFRSRARRARDVAAAQPVAPTLSAQQRLLLEDELDLYDS